MLVLVLLCGILVSNGFSETNTLVSVGFEPGTELSSLKFSLSTPAEYRIDPNPQRKTVRVVVKNSGFNPSLDFLDFTDENISKINFYTENLDTVAEIFLKDAKTSIYHDISRDRKVLTVNLRKRQVLMSLKTDIEKEERARERKKHDAALVQGLKLVSEQSGRDLYREGMELFQKGKYEESADKLYGFIERYPRSIYLEKAYFARAEGLYRLTRKKKEVLPEALEAYRLAAIRYPNSPSIPRARMRIAYLYLERDMDIEALASFEGIVENFPNSKFVLSALKGKADVFLKREEYAMAYNELEKILLLYPAAKEVRAARFKIAEAFYMQKRYETAFKIFYDSDKRWPTYIRTHVDSMNSFADTCYVLEKYDMALNLYTELSNLFPEADEGQMAMIRMGDIYAMRDMKEEALKLYGILARSKPTSTAGIEAKLRLAYMGHEDKKLVSDRDMVVVKYSAYLNPLDTYDEIIEKQKGTEQALKAMYQKGKLLYLQKRYVESILVLKDMMKEFPDSRHQEGVVELIRDNLYRMVDKFHNQEGYYTVLATYYENFDPFFTDIRDPLILLKLGDAYYEMGLFGRALEKYDLAGKADKLGYHKERLRFSRGRALLARKDYAEAEETLFPFSDVLDNSVYASEAVHHLGDIYKVTGDIDKAMETYKLAISLDPRNGRNVKSAYLIGVTYKDREEYPEAIRHLSRAISMPRPILDKDAEFYAKESYFQLIEALYRDGRYRDSVDLANAAMERFPDDKNNTWAMYIRSDAQAKLNEDEEAIASLKSISEKEADTLFGRMASAAVDNVNWKMKHKELFAN